MKTENDNQYYHDLDESIAWQEIIDFSKEEDKLINITQAVDDGKINPLEAFVKVKVLADMAKEVQKELQEQAVSEADKYPEKSFEKYGAKITKASGKATYSYNHIPEWEKANGVKRQIEQQAVQALKTAQMGRSIVDEETGEVMETAKVKYSADTIQVKLL